jgi:glycosyltransferase involved in cell wall biosynthesis
MMLPPMAEPGLASHETLTGSFPSLPGRPAAEPMHILQIVASIENEAAGTTIMVKRLAKSLAVLGHAVEVASAGLDASANQGALRARMFATQLTRVPILGRLQISRGLSAALDAAARERVVLHNHGLWRMPNIAACRAARRHRAPLVCSTHGMLATAALKYSPLQKAVFSKAVQRKALAAVSCFHATSRQELAEIRAFGIDAPVAVIPNGVDIPDPEPAPGRANRGLSQRTALFVGRLHPIKGLDRLLSAWARIEPRHPDWHLRIVGPSHAGHGEQLQNLAVRLGLHRVVFEDALYGEAKQAGLREADILVLPSLSENFGMVVAEALASGTPVIASKGTPWGGLHENRCGWWIDKGVDPLAAALASAVEMRRSALDAMGLRGRAWMAREYSWESVALSMAEVYRWCLARDEPPGTVVLGH